jgi:hypothetical protein
MVPWWDSTWLWTGAGLVVGAAIAAVVAVVLIAYISRRTPRA